MTDTELQEIRERHAYADRPYGSLGIKNVNLVYSGLGKLAHEDRGALLVELDRMRDALGAIAGGLEVDHPCDIARMALQPL